MPEKIVQKLWGMLMNNVVAFRRRVNKITDAESEPITTRARLEMPLWPSSDAPITTGKSGNMHGATTVNTPARIEMMKKTMLLNF